MPDQAESESALWLSEEFARQLTHVMESMTGEGARISTKAHELSAEEKESGENGLLWWEQKYSLGEDHLLWVGARRESWEEIGNQILRSAGVDDGDAESIRGTYLEIVNQALSGVASALSVRLHQEVTCKDGREAAPSVSSQAACYSFELSVGDKTLPVLAVLSAALANAKEAASAAPPETQQRTEPAASKSAAAESKNPSAVDLLLDVELPVSVSFGRAQLPLKDVIKLTTGSIVELNRAISEPVDVIVNNCVIARGEVVVVEGNYGIRIRQVISRQERLRTLY